MSSVASESMQTGFLDRAVVLDEREYPYQVYVPRTYTATSRWPVIVFLHGSGERGADGLKQALNGLGPALRRFPARYPALVVLPQAPPDTSWTGVTADMAMTALQRTLEEFAADPTRIYLTGLSLGGHGAWHLACRHPDRFAAVVPVCGWIRAGPPNPAADPVVHDDGDAFEAVARRLKRVPIWIVHGEVDAVVPVEESRRAAAALIAAGGNVRYTELIGVEHNAWDAAYGSAELAAWLFAQRRTA